MDAARDGDLSPRSEATAPLAVRFTATEITGLRHEVARLAAAHGLRDDRLDDFVFAVYEILTNAVRHGGGSGSLQLDHVGAELVCQVDDDGPGFAAGQLSAQSPLRTGGRGLQLVRELTDSLTIIPRTPGTSVEVRVSLAAVL
ncbi:ATP-binding protein [Plantactinospora soyae]|uniref:Anti-sigma regulatory factor (Ser/Thr protein kinase) n=1 Tax=Plantactinospora soyae TaxID=1544732 RepID=A0A927MBB3_9ACTN|nr:ATP-binding protein [Plantactinospora soyae]MBE1491422.1 anti-sigma regulatory factor (Ser/Thr protein kinase) [Plantactinospora soyae]